MLECALLIDKSFKTLAALWKVGRDRGWSKEMGHQAVHLRCPSEALAPVVTVEMESRAVFCCR